MTKYQKYAEYRNTESQWIDQIPSHWSMSALKHVLATPMTDGPHETPVFVDEGIPFVSAEAVSSGKIDFNKIRGFITVEDDRRFSQKYKPKLHDVYMIKSGATTGVTAIVETDQNFNIWSPLAAMRCKESFEPYYLLNYLRSDPFQKSVQLSWTFGTQQNIGMSTLENLPVCIPPLMEQRKISSFLTYETAKIDTLIAKQKKLIELLKEKRQAVISHAVTKGLNPNVAMKDSGVEWLGRVPEHWEILKFDYAINTVSDIDHYMPSSVDVGIPYIMTGDLKDFVSDIDFESCKQVAYSDYQKLSRKIKTTKDDIIFARYATIGTLSYVDIDKEFLVSYSCVTIKSNSNRTTGKYLSYYLKSQAFLQAIQQQINSNTQGNVGVDSLRNVKIILPLLSEQENIIEFLQAELIKMDNLINKAESAIQLMQERRTALISSAVTGKIDVRNWQHPNEAKTELSL